MHKPELGGDFNNFMENSAIGVVYVGHENNYKVQPDVSGCRMRCRFAQRITHQTLSGIRSGLKSIGEIIPG
jgi:hypothetical protein